MHSDEVVIPLANNELVGTLNLPRDAHGLVVFAHGSGSSRFSPRNQYVAEFLNDKGFGTLLMDLLTPAEEALDAVNGKWRFDISLLSQRIGAALQWLAGQSRLRALPLGLFGASTGAAAALSAAAKHDERVKAVVSRGGRPDLAGDLLALVSAPTLLIVGGNDLDVLELNRQAITRMTNITCLHVILGASHLFEEPGALQQVAQQAAQWFTRYLHGKEATANAAKHR